MVCHPDHRFVRRQLRERTRIDTVDFQKIQRRLNSRPFIAVKVRLTLYNVEGIGAGNLVQIPATVKVDILWLGYRRLKPVFATKTAQSSPRLELVLVNRVDLFPGEEEGL